MSCHYSCSTCSGNYYFDLCTSCPATRYLLISTCPCNSGYYQYAQNACTDASLVGGFDSTLISISNFAFYVAIGMHYLIIILTLNRVLSIKLKKIVDLFQIIALVGYYRFPQQQVASRALKIMDAFNFSYLNNLICDQSGPPYGCSSFQNLIGVGFTLILFILLFFVGYLIAACMYGYQSNNSDVIYIKNGQQTRGKNDKIFYLELYWKSLSRSFLLLYFDNTIIQTTVAISRIAIVNYYGILIAIPLLILIIVVTRLHFSTINNISQTTLAYRAKHNYFYYYDEFYHFNYIDHLFDKDNLNKDGELRKPYFPQSNLMIMEILFKILLATSTIVFYQYEPYLFAYCCLFLLFTYLCYMRIFFIYQMVQLLFYIIFMGVYAFSLATFSISYFFTYFIYFTSVGMLMLALVFTVITISGWKRQKEGQMFKKTFELEKELPENISNLEQSDEFILQPPKMVQKTEEIDERSITIENFLKSKKNSQNSMLVSKRGSISLQNSLVFSRAKRISRDQQFTIGQTNTIEPRIKRINRDDLTSNNLKKTVSFVDNNNKKIEMIHQDSNQSIDQDPKIKLQKGDNIFDKISQ